MKAQDILDMNVVDSTGQNVGDIKTIDINGADGSINYIEIKLDKGIFSRETEKVDYSSVDNISDVILLNKRIEMDN